MNDAPSGYQIHQAVSAWMAAREALLGADPGLLDDEAALIEALGPEDAEVHEMLARLLRATMHARDMAEAADERARTIQGRRDRYRRRAETLVQTALQVLQTTGERRVELADLTATIRRNPDSVAIIDADAVPDTLCRIVTTRTPDKMAIGKLLKAGSDVTGATLTNGSESLQIRIL